MDECRKALEEIAKVEQSVCYSESVGLTREFELMSALRQCGDIARKTLARTEAKVSGEVEQAFQVLEMYGVPRARAVTVANGIEVLATRLRKAIPAPQSPVVPGVRELEAILMKTLRPTVSINATGNKIRPKDVKMTTNSAEVAEAIRAHLLANARESREGFDTEIAAKAIFARDRSQRGSWDELHPADQNYYYETAQKVRLEALATVGKEG